MDPDAHNRAFHPGDPKSTISRCTKVFGKQQHEKLPSGERVSKDSNLHFIMSQDLSREREIALRAIAIAVEISQKVFNSALLKETSISKEDFSPVTIADYAVQVAINTVIHKEFPQDAIIAEENSATLRSSGQLTDQVRQLVNGVRCSDLQNEDIFTALDAGKPLEGSSLSRFWTIDPIDGTKGFLRGEQYAICIALVERGEVKLGILACPNYLDVGTTLGPHKNFAEQRGVVFIAVKGQGAYEIRHEKEIPIGVSSVCDVKEATMCESFESSHSSHDVSRTLRSKLGINTHPLRMDSQCKYAAIARGDSSIYFRMPPNEKYREYIWDHAAGCLIVTEAGGMVTDFFGNPLDFSQTPKLRNNIGIVATNKKLHSQVISALVGLKQDNDLIAS